MCHSIDALLCAYFRAGGRSWGRHGVVLPESGTGRLRDRQCNGQCQWLGPRQRLPDHKGPRVNRLYTSPVAPIGLDYCLRDQSTSACHRHCHKLALTMHSCQVPCMGSVDATYQKIKENLQQLGQKYVDLLLIHFPGRGDRENPSPMGCKGPCKNSSDIQDTWRALSRAQEEGLTRAIGVSNFKPEHIAWILELGLAAPAVNQCSMHIGPGGYDNHTISYCKEHSESHP